jgi:prepilin peptidase CpaA
VHAPLWVAAPVIALVAMATQADVRNRKIPNVLTGLGLLFGIAAHLVLDGPTGALNALIGALIAGGILFPGWLMGFMGAGDVKLMAAVGAWLGYPNALLAAVAALIAGGLISVIVAARKGVLMQAARNAVRLGVSLVVGRGKSSGVPPVTTGVRFPFAPAVLIGAIFVLLWRA